MFCKLFTSTIIFFDKIAVDLSFPREFSTFIVIFPKCLVSAFTILNV